MTSVRSDLELERDGARHFPDVLQPSEVDALRTSLAHLPPDRPGLRLTGDPALQRLRSMDEIARGALGSSARKVRAVLFDKSATTNWTLGWHQDRTIVVKGRFEAAGYGPWSIKAGLQHVEPPFEVLAGMVTLRLHLDMVDRGNAPLLIAPGSHRLGRITEDRVRETVAERGVAACLAQAGDVWLYATPILHASDAATTPLRRRVLQIDYAGHELPGGLEWLGV